MCPFILQERRKEFLKKTAASYIADSDTLKILKPLQKLSKTRGAMAEVTQAACIVTEVPEIQQGDTSNQRSLAETVLTCFQHTKTTCDTCLNKLPFFKPMRKGMRTVAESAAFDAVIIGVILLNTIVLALYHHGIESSFEKILDLCNMVRKYYSLDDLNLIRISLICRNEGLLHSPNLILDYLLTGHDQSRALSFRKLFRFGLKAVKYLSVWFKLNGQLP